MRGRAVLVGTAIALVAFNLRPAVARVGPVLPEVRVDLNLSGIEAALLTTLPVLCFGMLEPTAPRLARRAGIEPVLIAALLILVRHGRCHSWGPPPPDTPKGGAALPCLTYRSRRIPASSTPAASPTG